LELQAYFDKQIKKINKALDACLPGESERPFSLHRAMRYSVLSGGKRIRPIFVLAACQAVGGDEKKVMPAACALELIHNYSLIHDDLPCMDNDDLRRGQPTCHKKFGEDTALLAGDALLTLAFEILNSPAGPAKTKDAAKRIETAYFIGKAIGSKGMVGGQQVDMEFQAKEADLPTIEYINTHKTGALITASLRAGAVLGGGSDKEVEALTGYGRYTGLLFQIVDDILDQEGYAKVIGVPEAKKEADKILLRAKKELKSFGRRGETLSRIADFVLNRKF
jgi:geranylgeranyl diphosphate synthase type II